MPAGAERRATIPRMRRRPWSGLGLGPRTAAGAEPSGEGITPGDVSRELRDFARRQERRRRVVPRAVRRLL